MRIFHWKEIGSDRCDQLGFSWLRGQNAFPGHTHDFPEIFWIIDGEGIHLINGREVPLSGGHVVAIRWRDRHGFHSTARGMRIRNAAFSPGWWRGMTKRYPYVRKQMWPCGSNEPQTWIVDSGTIHRLEKEAEDLAWSPGDKLDADRFLLNVCHLLAPRRSGPERSSIQPDWLRRAFERMEGGNNFEVQAVDFARIAGRSLEHVSREVRRTTGRTLTDWLQERKIRQAGILLRGTDRTVLDIALSSGFETLGHFYEVFRKFEGMTPGEFRKSGPKRAI